MAEKLEDNVFQQVDSAASIVSVTSYYLGNQNLIRKGRIFVAICPFHSDSHPSMRIDPSRNNYHCFSCGAVGGPIKFAKEYGHMEYIPALKKVCEICSLPIPESISKGSSFVDKKEQEYSKELDAMIQLSKFYQLSLSTKEGQAAKDYLAQRKIDDETISHFQIGYSPLDKSASINTLRKLGYDVSTLERAGIITNSSRLEDRYSGRLMFPLKDMRGHVVGFSGRKISSEQTGGKYENSNESLIFHKGEMLYHFSEAKEEAKRVGYIYIVEGFMDVIALYRAGIKSAVGSMGTAITDNHVRALKNLNVDIRLCLDSDEPGQEGMEKAIRVFLKNECKVRIVRKFKDGKDSDEVLTNHGKDALIGDVNRLYDPFLFLFGRALKGRMELTDPLEINTFMSNARDVYASLNEVEKSQDLDILVRVTHLDKETLTKLLKRDMTPKENTSAKENPSPDENDTPTGRKPKKDYHDYIRGGRDRKYYPISNPIMDQNYNKIDFFQSLIAMASSTEEGSKLYPELIENESQIIMVLTKSRKAYSDYQEARIDFAYTPFYVIACAIGNIYLSDRSADSFTVQDYENLQNMIFSRRDIEDDDPLGINEIDDEMEETEDYEEDLLRTIIEYMSKIDSTFYDPNRFRNALKLHPDYVRYSTYLDKIGKQGNQKTSDDIMEGAKLIAAIKKHGGKIRK